jgi:hypothetical protein
LRFARPKTQQVKSKNPFFSKIFYSFFHIELQDLGFENQEPFSPQSRIFALLREGGIISKRPLASSYCLFATPFGGLAAA